MKVLFYPDPPTQQPGHSLSKTIRYFQIIGYELTNDINSDWEIAVHWNYNDLKDTDRLFLEDNRIVLNRDLRNVNKDYVDEIFTQSFGYSSMADTDKFGFCIRKSNRQSAHDGVIMKTPCEREPGYIYQLFLDNRDSISTVYDIRIPVFMGRIPLIFIKSRGIEGCFENTLSDNKNYWIEKPEDCLYHWEIDLIQLFCESMGFDLGEIDAIRDNSTGKLYLIDVNDIPGGAVFDHIKDGKEVEKRLAYYLNELL